MLVAKVVTVLNILNAGFIEATKELAAKQVKENSFARTKKIKTTKEKIKKKTKETINTSKPAKTTTS